ncbi:sarcosine oxidase subunit alpha family protein [Pseudoroseicyclus sp. H15]
MSARLPQGGRLLDRAAPLEFRFDGKRLRGFAGDTLASALMGQGQMLLGRSFKYHRPRGAVASGAEEPNALVGLGEGAFFEPNQRATVTELYDGLTAISQNHWPSLDHDIGAVNTALTRFLPAGFYYKTFLWPRAFWKHLYEPFIRQSAGLGKPPKEKDGSTYEHFHAHVDLVIVGGGIAGLATARAAGREGRQVLLMEQSAHWGGRAVVDAPEIDGQSAEDWVKSAVQELEGMENVRLRLRCMAAGLYDHGYLLAYERLTDHAPGEPGPRHRLWRLRTQEIVLATGALERPLSFAGNDVPGVMLASAMRDYLVNWAVSPGDRTVVVTNNDDAYRTALALHRAGLSVAAIIDARTEVTGALPQAARDAGIRVEPGRAVVKVHGGKQVTGVGIGLQIGEGGALEEIACDAVAMSGGWSPAVHLWSHSGGKLNWDEAGAMFRPDASRPPLGDKGQAMARVVGSANGHLGTAAALEDAGLTVPVSEAEEQPLAPVWLMPQGAGPALKRKMFLDYQNDVKVSDVELAAREGYESVEHAKRYTTLGMATDQGKLSNINGLAVLSNALNAAIPATGTTTFRPPYTPISMGSIAGSATGPRFQPVRKTPMHDWHASHGATWEPVGQWRRPYAYLKSGEDTHAAVAREVKAVRSSLGMLDASTLGKIVVKGPDAGRFLDMIYTGRPSTIPVGKCRYGLICNENGFLIDDGVAARLSEDTWLCHTTTGGAESIHAHMEDWLQCEWWDWQVYTANVTEEWAQVAVVGPKAREVLETLGGVDVSKEALPFMGWGEGTLGGLPARIFRISFSGELSYEIAVPASHGPELWEALLQAGQPHGVTPYGTEAMHVLRAEKGYVMIGEETDGTIIPQDLNLGWAIAKKKDDYLGKRAHERSHMADPNRWKLVGLRAEDDVVLPEGAYILAAGDNANGQRNTQGRITSTYYSPTFGRGIAMALLIHGPDRMGETVEVTDGKGGTITATVCETTLYDPEGERLNG